MKKYITSIILGISTIGFAQNIAEYRYIHVPSFFEKDRNMNDYNLRTILVDGLKAKQYSIIQDENTIAGNNKNCDILNAELLDDSSFLKNKIKVNFKNCKNEVVFQAKGSSSNKEFNIGFPEALKQALTSISISNPTTSVAKKDDHQHSAESTGNSTNKEGSFYINQNQNYQFVQLRVNQFILISTQKSVPFATFTESSHPGIYHVTLDNSVKTIGYIQNDAIVIDIPEVNGGYKTEVFSKK